jgi:hypothetical protein
VDQAFERRARVLFLDDDPARGKSFVAEYPGAVWVRTAEECIDRLSEPWDEVHLDHDLGGEVFVDHEREDCGMAVVRWLCDQPRPDLKSTRFFVHTHNVNAACLMALRLEAMEYDVQIRPFGAAPARPARLGHVRSVAVRVIRWLRGDSDGRIAPMEIGIRVDPSAGPRPGRPKPGGSSSDSAR